MTNYHLWKQLECFEFDPDGVEFSFSQRLARENNWSENYTKRVILEYKKFIYLCCITDHQITPSDSVDQVWHLHLTYTHSYWNELCQKTLGRNLHHHPTKGGTMEKKNSHHVIIQLLKSTSKSLMKIPQKIFGRKPGFVLEKGISNELIRMLTGLFENLPKQSAVILGFFCLLYRSQVCSSKLRIRME